MFLFDRMAHFYRELGFADKEARGKALELTMWEANFKKQGFLAPLDGSQESHDWWDHFPLVMPPVEYFEGKMYLPPSLEGEAFAFLLRQVIKACKEGKINRDITDPVGTLEFAMMHQRRKATYNKQVIEQWVLELVNEYRKVFA